MAVSFSVGDKVIYPGHGLSTILDIEHMSVNRGQAQSFFRLRIEETGAKVLIPIANAAHVGLRKTVSLSELEDVLSTLRDHCQVIDRQTWVRRARGYQEKLRSGILCEVAEVYRDLQLLRQAKGLLSFSEKRVLDTCRRQLVSEIALVQKAPEEKVDAMLQGFFVRTLKVGAAAA